MKCSVSTQCTLQREKNGTIPFLEVVGKSKERKKKTLIRKKPNDANQNHSKVQEEKAETMGEALKGNNK